MHEANTLLHSTPLQGRCATAYITHVCARAAGRRDATGEAGDAVRLIQVVHLYVVERDWKAGGVTNFGVVEVKPATC